MKACGKFKITVLDSQGNIVRELPEQKNTLTEYMLERISRFFAWSQYLRHIVVGTGNSPPDQTQLSLDNQIGPISPPGTILSSVFDNAEKKMSTTIRVAFDQGSIVGNIAELGIHANSGNTLGSRALITDELGNPTTIALSESNVLVVDYTVEVYFGTVVANKVTEESVVIDGVNTVVRTAIFMSNQSTMTRNSGNVFTAVYEGVDPDLTAHSLEYFHDFSTISALSLGTYLGATANSAPNSFSSEYPTSEVGTDYTLIMGVDRGNFNAGISAAAWGAGGLNRINHAIVTTFDPPIAKTNQDILTLKLGSRAENI